MSTCRNTFARIGLWKELNFNDDAAVLLAATPAAVAGRARNFKVSFPCLYHPGAGSLILPILGKEGILQRRLLDRDADG